jgi:acetyl-CoA synthetase
MELFQTAIVWEADEPGEGCSVTYAELLREVCALANVLKSFGVKKGDTVSLYLPMTWQAVAAFLACEYYFHFHDSCPLCPTRFRPS